MARRKMFGRRINLVISQKHFEILQRIAERDQTTISDIIRDLIISLDDSGIEEINNKGEIKNDNNNIRENAQ